MPNHVLNTITLKGTPERITEILEKIKYDEIGIGSIDFEKIIPMPSNIYRGALGLKEREQYGENNWYDWSIKNWGTKWNAYGYGDDFKYSQFDPIIFQTAWNAPHPVIEKLFMMFQDVEIVHEWADEGVARNCGRRIYNQEGLYGWHPMFKKAAIRFQTALWNTQWEQITYDIKCPCYDCEHFKKDASENPCLGCTCKYKWVEGVNRAFRYKPTRMPVRKEKKDDQP